MLLTRPHYPDMAVRVLGVGYGVRPTCVLAMLLTGPHPPDMADKRWNDGLGRPPERMVS